MDGDDELGIEIILGIGIDIGIGICIGVDRIESESIIYRSWRGITAKAYFNRKARGVVHHKESGHRKTKTKQQLDDKDNRETLQEDRRLQSLCEKVNLKRRPPRV